MRKKGLLTTLFAFGVLTMLGTGQGVEAKELNKFIRNDAGELGYDENQKVPLYLESTELINIPETYETPKELFQSSWVATIQNLNFQQPNSEEDFQQNYLKVLKDFKEWNMNAMIFQVRPLLDSWYPSEFNPWSEFLSGAQGQNPGYNPLSWMVDETHRQGMEYHAWLNPYRVSNTKFNNANLQKKTGKTESELTELSIIELIKLFNEKEILADNNYAVLHPEHVLIFDQKLFLNPGIPEVRQHVFDTVEELTRKYDIDAIHFDDYFYPYRITVDGENVFFGTNGEDQATFEKYGQGFSSIDSWRRHNIDLLAEGVKATIDSVNTELGKSVQFGVSPFGIWEHKENDARGSHTPLGSSQSYSGSIFADTYKWVKEETVDYMAPQIYWSFDQGAAPYGELTKWWNDVAEGTHTQIYIGHANYKHVSNGGWDVSWLNPEEIPNQLKYNTEFKNVKGSALFSYNDIQYSDINSLADNLKERHTAKNKSIDLLKSNYFNQLALVPAKPWLSQGEVLPPKNVEVNNKTASWEASENSKERFYIVYSGEGASKEVISDSKNIMTRIFNDGSQNYTYVLPETATEEVYVTTVDAAGVESEAFVEEVPAETGQVTVYHKEKATQKELDKVVLEGEVGTPFKIERKEIEGYELMSSESNLTGTFTKEAQIVDVLYSAIITETSTTSSSTTSTTTTSTKDSTSTTDSTTTETTRKGSASGSFTSNSKEYVPIKNLPQTGEANKSKIFVVLGLLLTAATAICLRKEIKE